jgi:hypothetical protein
MMSRIRHTSRAAFVTTAIAALVATTHFAEAKKPKPDPAILVATTLAAQSTTDIENVAGIGIPVATNIGSGVIKLSTTNVNALVAGLAGAILGKTLDPNNHVTIANKADEIGEVAAFVMQGLVGNAKVQKAKDGKKYAVAVMKNALKAAIKPAAGIPLAIISDVVGSVALTLQNDARITDAEQAKLQKSLIKAAASIAGKKNKNVVKGALLAGFTAPAIPTPPFEDGNIATLTTITDPETDFRNA